MWTVSSVHIDSTHQSEVLTVSGNNTRSVFDKIDRTYYCCYQEVHCTLAPMTMAVLPSKEDHIQRVVHHPYQVPYLVVGLVVRWVDHIVMVLEVDCSPVVDRNNCC